SWAKVSISIFATSSGIARPCACTWIATIRSDECLPIATAVPTIAWCFRRRRARPADKLNSRDRFAEKSRNLTGFFTHPGSALEQRFKNGALLFPVVQLGHF